MPSALDDRLSERIRQAVDEGFEEQVAFTADLVRAPSLMGNEAGAQNLMERGMRELGTAGASTLPAWRACVPSLHPRSRTRGRSTSSDPLGAQAGLQSLQHTTLANLLDVLHGDPYVTATCASGPSAP